MVLYIGHESGKYEAGTGFYISRHRHIRFWTGKWKNL